MSVIGGDLCAGIVESKKYCRGVGNVRTADGQRQRVIGTVTLEIEYNSQSKSIIFVLIPSITQDVICGMGFWEKFGIRIVIENTECELASVEGSE